MSVNALVRGGDDVAERPSSRPASPATCGTALQSGSGTGPDDALDRFVHRDELRAAAIPTGFPDLDRLTGGLRPGTIVAVASRPAMGRTTFVLNIAEHISLTLRRPVAFFCNEEGAYALVDQLLASRSGVCRDARCYVRELDCSESELLATAVNEVRDAPLMIDDTTLLTPTEIVDRTLAFAAKNEAPMGAVIIDIEHPSWKVRSRKEARATTEEAVSRFGAVAAQLRAPLIITAQLSRGPEHRRDHFPRLTDFRCRDLPLARAADVVMMLCNHDVYWPDDAMGLTYLAVAKNRFGHTGSIALRHQFEYGRLREYAL